MVVILQISLTFLQCHPTEGASFLGSVLIFHYFWSFPYSRSRCFHNLPYRWSPPGIEYIHASWKKRKMAILGRDSSTIKSEGVRSGKESTNNIPHLPYPKFVELLGEGLSRRCSWIPPRTHLDFLTLSPRLMNRTWNWTAINFSKALYWGRLHQHLYSRVCGDRGRRVDDKDIHDNPTHHIVGISVSG